MVTFGYVSAVVLTPLTAFCFFWFLHWTKSDYRVFVKPSSREDFFGYMIDNHTVVHLYFGFLLSWVIGIWVALFVNLAWEIWDANKSTQPLLASETDDVFDRVRIWFHNNFFVSEGKFDVCDFVVMAFGSLMAWSIKTAFGF
jgi:hypothetical protein